MCLQSGAIAARTVCKRTQWLNDPIWGGIVTFGHPKPKMNRLLFHISGLSHQARHDSNIMILIEKAATCGLPYSYGLNPFEGDCVVSLWCFCGHLKLQGLPESFSHIYTLKAIALWLHFLFSWDVLKLYHLL